MAALARNRAIVAQGLADGQLGAPALGDGVLEMMAEQFRRFVDNKVTPFAHQWHLDNDYIPLGLIAEMAELGVFGLTVPEEWGGTGLGKLAMSLATEELSRGYIGVGSLGTRAEIAGELIRLGGTPEQKQRYLAKNRLGRNPRRRLHRAGHRLGPRRAQGSRRADRKAGRQKSVARHRQQDLDHSRRAR